MAVDVTLEVTEATQRPSNGNGFLVDLENVDVAEFIGQLDPADVLECLDKSDVMEYFKDDNES